VATTVVHVGPERGFGWLGDRFREAGFATETFSLSRPVDFRCLADLTAKLARWIEPTSYTVMSSRCACTALRRRRRLSVPHVTTMHGNQEMTAKLRRRLALRWAFRNSRMAIACSDWTRRDVERSLGLKAITRCMPFATACPSGRAFASRSARNCSSTSEDAVLIVAVGNVVPRKGHLQLLQALARVEQQGGPGNWHVAIAGDTPRRSSLDRCVRRGAQLVFPRPPARRHARMSPTCSQPPTSSSCRPCGRACRSPCSRPCSPGKPIIASDVSGIPEAIASDRYGLLARAR
jgi:glycosyltransferase involved in cell wall biosynthesis